MLAPADVAATQQLSRVLETLNFLRLRKRAYQLTFRSPMGAEVLKDLAAFCRADKTAFHKDERVHAAFEGRREVWLRIQQHLGLTPEELQKLYTGHYPITQPEE